MPTQTTSIINLNLWNLQTLKEYTEIIAPLTQETAINISTAVRPI